MELNHFYDEHGRLVFDQIIFYDWMPYVITEEIEVEKVGIHEVIKKSEGYRYQVRAWRLVKNPNQIPNRDWRCGGYSAMWQDGEQLRFVISKSIRETWTQYDPELVEREYLPKEKRKELRVIRIDRPSGAIRPTVPTEANENGP